MDSSVFVKLNGLPLKALESSYSVTVFSLSKSFPNRETISFAFGSRCNYMRRLICVKKSLTSSLVIFSRLDGVSLEAGMYDFVSGMLPNSVPARREVDSCNEVTSSSNSNSSSTSESESASEKSIYS